MTYSYTADVATSSGFGCFLPLLLRWRGSIYKLVWLDLLTFLSLYYILNLTYLYLLNPEQKTIFENVSQYCKNSSLIPLSFVLGFYVSIVMGRWWAQYLAIPWPDSIAVYVSAHIHGTDDRARLLRRTIMRYVCLCLTMVFTYVSQRVKKRFPTWDYLVDAGLLLENEKNIIDRLDVLFPYYPKHWLPIVWSASIVKRARSEGRIRDDFAVKTIIDELNKFRGSAGFVLFYDFISVPLVYTQVVTLAVYSYFIFNIMGCQCLDKPNDLGYYDVVDKYFPIFATLEFFFYMGWLKVAESLINPFGEDDDDFEVNWLVDRNLQVSYLIVDDMHQNHPELVRDQFWDEVFPVEMPYGSSTKREEPPEPSTAKVVPTAQAAGSVEYRSTVTLYKAISRYSQHKPRVSFTSGESSSSTSSMRAKQIGIVSPLNITKPTNTNQDRKFTAESWVSLNVPETTIMDDFELLRRRREQERRQRHVDNMNRTVENLHSVADSNTVIHLLPTRTLVMTDSEASLASALLSDEQNVATAQSKAKTKPKVKISEPIKSRDQFEHLKKIREDEREERRRSSLQMTESMNKPGVSKLAAMARKAADQATTSKSTSRVSATVGQQTSTTGLEKKAGIKKASSEQTFASDVSDSEGSISFTDAQADEKAESTYRDVTDEPSDNEKPEIFKDQRTNSEANSLYEDVANESATNDASEQNKWQQVETDASTEYDDPPEESSKAKSVDKTKPKTEDKNKKKR